MMNLVENDGVILQKIKGVRSYRKEYITNFFPDQEKVGLWLQLKILFYKEFSETIIFFRKNDFFYHVYYCSSQIEKLGEAIVALTTGYPGVIFIIDLVENRKKIAPLTDFFQSRGFSIYASLSRMNKLTSQLLDYHISEGVCFAEKDDFDMVKTMLYHNFDSYAEQLPLDEELNRWISDKRVLKFLVNDDTGGFLIYDLRGITSILKYWFVKPEYRNRGVGSSLLQYFFMLSKDTRRQLFWVIDSNENAIRRYKHYGFEFEQLVDYVMINKNIKYEEKCN